MRTIDLSIIIVSYNTAKLTGECIESIIATVKKVSYEVIIVDNASSDDSVHHIQKLKEKNQQYNSKIKIIQNEKNYGFSKANNIGAKQSTGRYVLFLNSDTVVYEKTIDGMVEFMDQNPEVGSATCRLFLPDGRFDDGSHRGFPTPLRSFFHFSGISKVFPTSPFFNGYNLGWKDENTIHEIEALVGAFMIVRRDAGEPLGWWDEDFFWYGEDLDFCYRLKKNGWKIYYVPDYSILHYKGMSGGIKKHSQKASTASKETRIRSINARFDAMKIFYNKHYRAVYPGIITHPVLLVIEAKRFLTKMRI